eukprot:gene32663-39489_t
MAVPPKFRHMNSFHEYLVGTKVAPVLTIFVGGNHEASNVLQDLYYGGYVAPNIYFLGISGVVRFKWLRIAGISGIFDKRHYDQPHFEAPPYTPNTLRSVYHTRSIDIHRLACLQEETRESRKPVDIFISHDWPLGVYDHGDVRRLLAIKPFFREDIDKGELGSPALASILQTLRPGFWFAAHLHVKFEAIVAHQDGKLTQFLALDKVIKGRDFLQFLTIPSPSHPSSVGSSLTGDRVPQEDLYSDNELHFDLPFLSIVRSTHYLNKPNSKYENFAATQPLSTENLKNTMAMLSSVYGEDLVVPPMQRIIDSSSLDAFVRSRGNIQTDKLLAALNLHHLPPWVVPVDEGVKAQLDYLYTDTGRFIRSRSSSSNSGVMLFLKRRLQTATPCTPTF